MLVVRPGVSDGEVSIPGPGADAVGGAVGGSGLRSALRDEGEKEAAGVRLGEIRAEISALLPQEQSPPRRGALFGLWHLEAGIEEDLDRYGRLTAGQITDFGMRDMRELGEALVKARLSRGIDLGQLAAAVGLGADDLGRHEREGYQNAPIWLLDAEATAVAEETNISLRLPAPPRTGPWSVLEEISEGRAVVLTGRGTLTLQGDRYERDGDGPSNERGDVDVSLTYHPAESGNLDVRLALRSRDEGGKKILSWQPKDATEQTTPRYDFRGHVDSPDGAVGASMSPVYVDFSLGAAGHTLGWDSARRLSAGPGLGSTPTKLKALVPNLHADVSGETGGLRFALAPTGEVQPDGVFPDQVGKILPGCYLELEVIEGEEADLEEAVAAFGHLLSFFAGRAVHPIAWEAETPGGPYWTVQSVREPSRLPDEFRGTCLPVGVLERFLTRAWEDGVIA